MASPNKNSNAYVLSFTIVLCAVLAVCLAATYNGFKATIESNELFDQQKNILKAVGLYDPRADAGKSRAELEGLLEKYVRGQVLEVKRAVSMRNVRRGGREVEEPVEEVVDVLETEFSVDDLPDLQRTERRKRKGEPRREFVTFYRRIDDAGSDVAYCIPISGYGLWSTLYGFLGFEPDLDRVKGITFYRHAETPGLGGEVDNLDWQAQWESKRIRDDSGEVVSVAVKKGVVDPSIARERDHMVDGLSGATITGNGVTRFVERDLRTYERWFQKLLKKD